MQAGSFVAPRDAGAASPEPVPDSRVSVTAEPMLGGSFRFGSWVAVRVSVENDGPAIDGELRLAGTARGSSTFSVAVQLATGSRQQHVLYGQLALFGDRYTVALVSGDLVHASASAPVNSRDWRSLGVYVVAERPQGLVGPILARASTGASEEPNVQTIRPEDLPPRAEAWSSIDLLVWQDVDSRRLDRDRLDALRTWLATGGDLVILGGSTGAVTLGSFEADLLPFRPAGTIDLPVADLEAALGALPAEAQPLPALSGRLERGVALVSGGDGVVAARAPYGQGTVGVIGIDPSTPWLASSPAGVALWSTALPSSLGTLDPRQATSDDFLVGSLSSLPAIQLPRLDHVFLLIVVYIVAIGPLNYVLLRRRDRREWAWLTMPLTIAIFAVGAYFFGVTLRGAEVVVNELSVVYGAAGADRGLAHFYVGVYSPQRASFDVSVGGDTLLSATTTAFQGETAERPLDVLHGDPAIVRGYGVGFGALRAFRAQVAVATPRIATELALVGGSVEGTIINASDTPLANVSLVYGSSFRIVGDLAPGQSASVRLATAGGFGDGEALSWRLIPAPPQGDAEATRTAAARRALIQHLSGGWDEGRRGGASGLRVGGGPVVLAWQSGGSLDIDVGLAAEHVGERLYVLPARLAVSGPVALAGGLLQPSIVSFEAEEGFSEGGWFYMGRGTAVIDYRAGGFDGSFRATSLTFRLDHSQDPLSAGDATELAPLPADEQPDPDQPLAADPRPDDRFSGAPRVQLFDRVAGTWIEFEPVSIAQTYGVAEPQRFVDQSGAFRVGFVVRSRDYFEFAFNPRIEGTVE